jgi:UDP-N-acetylmuramate dehydrogenase
MLTLCKFIEKINREGRFSPAIRFDEPMSGHSTFKVGGKADAWIRPGKSIFPDYAARLLKTAEEEGVPVFVLGAGANIVVSDKGIRGIVLDTGAFRGGIGKKEKIESPSGEKYFSVPVQSGTAVDALVSRLAEKGLSGMEFLAGMPGSVGGAVWMNARCYEKSVSDVLLETEILDENHERQKIPFRAEDFSYKKSPFQGGKSLILSARFALRCRDASDIRAEMAAFRKDRVDKGHYRYPSAGSAFKNNRDFGDPTGKIIDQLGLRGLSKGGAQIAPWHGNIIINTGNAAASDIRALMDEAATRVKKERGFDLESEILFVGDW